MNSHALVLIKVDGECKSCIMNKFCEICFVFSILFIFKYLQ